MLLIFINCKVHYWSLSLSLLFFCMRCRKEMGCRLENYRCSIGTRGYLLLFLSVSGIILFFFLKTWQEMPVSGIILSIVCVNS
jgi:hypothetical protein